MTVIRHSLDVQCWRPIKQNIAFKSKHWSSFPRLCRLNWIYCLGNPNKLSASLSCRNSTNIWNIFLSCSMFANWSVIMRYRVWQRPCARVLVGGHLFLLNSLHRGTCCLWHRLLATVFCRSVILGPFYIDLSSVSVPLYTTLLLSYFVLMY